MDVKKGGPKRSIDLGRPRLTSHRLLQAFSIEIPLAWVRRNASFIVTVLDAKVPSASLAIPSDTLT